MTNTPKALTTPPEGYEWDGEPRGIACGEYWAHWRDGKWVALKRKDPNVSWGNLPPLRKIEPEYVWVKIPKVTAEALNAPISAERDMIVQKPHASILTAACAEVINRDAIVRDTVIVEMPKDVRDAYATEDPTPHTYAKLLEACRKSKEQE